MVRRHHAVPFVWRGFSSPAIVPKATKLKHPPVQRLSRARPKFISRQALAANLVTEGATVDRLIPRGYCFDWPYNTIRMVKIYFV